MEFSKIGWSAMSNSYILLLDRASSMCKWQQENQGAFEAKWRMDWVLSESGATEFDQEMDALLQSAE